MRLKVLIFGYKPKSKKNRQMFRKSEITWGWLEFRRNLDHIDCSDAIYFSKHFQTNETNERLLKNHWNTFFLKMMPSLLDVKCNSWPVNSNQRPIAESVDLPMRLGLIVLTACGGHFAISALFWPCENFIGLPIRITD